MTWGNPFACAEQSWIEFLLISSFYIVVTIASSIIIRRDYAAFTEYKKIGDKCP